MTSRITRLGIVYYFKQLILLGLVTLVVGFALWPLWQDMQTSTNPNEIPGTTPVVAKVLETKASANHRLNTGLTWYPLKKGASIFLYGSVLTGEDSAARIQLNDGTILSLSANTLISFAKKRGAKKVHFELDQGELKLYAPSSESQFLLAGKEIRLPKKSVATLRRDSFYREESLQVEVGTAFISDPHKGQLKLQRGETVGKKALGDFEKGVAAFEAVPVSPGNEEVIESKSRKSTLTFHWQGKGAQYLEVDSNGDFLQPKRFRTRGGNSYRLTLTRGTYHWRVSRGRSVSESNVFSIKRPPPRLAKRKPKPKPKPKPSPKKKIAKPTPSPVRTVASKPSPSVLPPPAIKKADGSSAFSWNAVANATGYVVEIDTTEKFEAPLVYDVRSTGINLSGLLGGQASYYWRVAARDKDGQLGAWSKARQLGSEKKN